MKKKFMAIALSLFMIVPMFSYADTKLTYDNALKKAIENNLNLEKTKKTIDNINSSLTEGSSSQIKNSDMNSSSIIGDSINYQSLIDSEKTAKMNYDSQKEAIALALKNVFLKIEYLEENSKLIQEKMSNMSQNQSVNNVRYNIGMMSKIEFDNFSLEMDKLKKLQKENELNLTMAYKNLENIMGTKNNGNIEYIKIEYKTLLELGMSKEAAIGKAISQAPSIFQQNSSIKLLQERIKYGLLDNSQTALPKEEATLNVSIQDANLRINKQQLENTVIETANNIENLELTIKDLNSQIENMQMQSKNTAKLVELGFKPKLELENLNLKIKELQMQKKNLLNNHNILVERYSKPYLLSLAGE